MNLRALWPFGRKAQAFDLPKEFLTLLESKTGERVTASTALRVSAVFACVRVLSEGVAQVPCKLYRQQGREKVEARDHPLFDLLDCKPNAYMTAFSLFETAMIHALMAGGAVCFVNRIGRERKVSEIIPLDPSTVTCEKGAMLGDAPRWIVQGKNGDRQEFPAEAIWHIPGPSWDGVMGMDVIRLAREAIGLSMATESSQVRLHKNGVRVSGTYSVEGTLSVEQHKQLREWLAQNYAGADNAAAPMVLDRGAKWLQTTMSGVDAQHLETRKYQVEEVCRFFRVMPIMAGYSDKAATYASAEQMFLAHVVHTLAPWYRRIEKSMDAYLLTEQERRDGYYTKFVTAGLLRGALKDTAEFLTKLVTNGVLTRNEAREKLEFNPLDGLDEPLTPLNMQEPEKEPPDA